MSKQEIINKVLMNSDESLMKMFDKEHIKEMYVTLTGDTEDRTVQQYVFLMRHFVTATHLHKGNIRQLYAVHTKETEVFRAVYTLNTVYGEEMLYPYGIIRTAYKQLIPNGTAKTDDDKILEMVDFLREHDAPAVYE